MRKIGGIILLLLFSELLFSQVTEIDPGDWPSLKGLWTFDNPANLLEATFGTDLAINGSHTSIAGPGSNDLAVNIGTGSYYTCYHNIPANGGGNTVNEYSLVIDFRIPVTGPWYCFYQTNATNGNDGELFVSPSATIGRATNGPGYTSYQILPGEWYRMVVTADLGNSYNIYLDGVLVKSGGSLSIDGDYALYPLSGNNFFYFFADNDGEDAPVDIALCAVFNGALTMQEAGFLGGYGHEIPPVLSDMLPYLQTPSPTSVYISWHCDSVTDSQVNFGLSGNLDQVAIGSVDNIGTKKWHTVKLENLYPDTVYSYQCISGAQQSEVYHFKTLPVPGTSGQHLRFLVFGDNQSDISKSTLVAAKARQKLTELYGQDFYRHVALILNHGDIVGNGTVYQSFEDEYFKPFSVLSGNIPSMVSIGNHEAESAYYYQYMKYEDLNGSSSTFNEKYYSFRIGNSKFISLNTNNQYQNSAQESFLIDQLQQAQEDSLVDFVFIYGHHPPLSEIWPDGNNDWVKDHVISNMKNYSKSAVYFSGHTHAYENAVWESSTDSGDFRVQINGGAGGALDRWGMYPNQQDYATTKKSVDHYHFTLIDVNVAEHSYEGFTYSLGNTDLPLNCELIDHFSRKLSDVKPEKPQLLSPSGKILSTDSLITHPIIFSIQPYNGIDSIMTIVFQLTDTPGDYSDPMEVRTVDIENWYGNSGSPWYHPVNLNQGLDPYNITVDTAFFPDHPYAWRVKFRDNNLRWSNWSEENTFTFVKGYNISGIVLYDNAAQSPLDSVVVALYRNDTLIVLDTTHENGSFLFKGVLPGNYRVKALSNKAWSGVNATDALLILRHFVGISPLVSLRRKAGDIDGNLVINAVDALAASKRFTGMIDYFPAGDWIFESPGFNVFYDDIDLIMRGLCIGDVNGSYIPFTVELH